MLLFFFYKHIYLYFSVHRIYLLCFRFAVIQSKIALYRSDTSQRAESRYCVSEPCIDLSYPLQTGEFPLAPQRLKYWRLLIRKPNKLRGDEKASAGRRGEESNPQACENVQLQQISRERISVKQTCLKGFACTLVFSQFTFLDCSITLKISFLKHVFKART